MHCIGIAAAARVASLQRGRLPTRRLALTSRLLGFTRDFTAAAQSADNNAMVGLEEACIIPDIINRVSPGSQAELEVAFGGQATIKNGQLLSPAAAATAPSLSIKGGSEGGLFTVVASDPDPPDPANPIYREWLHWMVTNIPSGGTANQGHEVTPWRGPSPPVGTHRYVFLLFEQPNQEPLQATDPSGGQPGKRGNFSTRDFAKQHSLGDPVAVKWFNAHK